MTGTAVNKSKKEEPWWWLNSGNSLGGCVFAAIKAAIAIAEHIPTNATARSVDIAELNFNDSEMKTAQH